MWKICPTLNWKDEVDVNQSNRGKAVIAGIFLVALVLSGYAWWHQFQQSRRCREFLGTETVKLVRLAPRVTLLRLEPMSADAENEELPSATVQIGDVTLAISKSVEITGVPGLLHARHALLQDMNYRWGPPTRCLGHWEFALKFEQDGDAATVAFDPKCSRIGQEGTNRLGLFSPDLMRTFTEKTDEWESRAADAG